MMICHKPFRYNSGAWRDRRRDGRTDRQNCYQYRTSALQCWT